MPIFSRLRASTYASTTLGYFHYDLWVLIHAARARATTYSLLQCAENTGTLKYSMHAKVPPCTVLHQCSSKTRLGHVLHGLLVWRTKSCRLPQQLIVCLLMYCRTCSFGQSRHIRSSDASLLSSMGGGRVATSILSITGVTVIFHPQSFTWEG